MASILIALMALSLVGVVFYAGVYYERLGWNKLIQEGKLPRPNEYRGG